MVLQFKQTAHESKPPFAEIDVGAKKLILVIRKNDTSFKVQKFTNAPADSARLVKDMANLPSIIVAWKPGLPIALHGIGVALMLVNPKASHNFVKVKALMKNSMRKRLHAIHDMLKHDKLFDNARFYAIPA